MNKIELDYDNVKSVIPEKEIVGLQGKVDKLHGDLNEGRGAGKEFLGWLRLPSQTSKSELDEINNAAGSIRDNCDVFICIGIGGSYLGAKAAINFTNHSFANVLARGGKGGPEIYFAGQNISSDYITDLLELVADKNICLNVISKSGTTTEPAIAFRILKDALEKKVGSAEAAKRIFVTTDKAKGALKAMADEAGYKSFVIPDDVGGRYSVLTPVGLLPMAVAGLDINEVLQGARYWEELSAQKSDLNENASYLYAVIRYLLFQQGKTTELMASFHPALFSLVEWWRQLAGESEGKDGTGIFPASAEYTTDLHSLGQWVQEGRRILFETFLLVESSSRQAEVPSFQDDSDGLNYLAGKSLDFINHKAYKGTAEAHLQGGVPNMAIKVKDRTPHTLGQLFYFFERSVALSGYLFGVNPFDQPGVEKYKNNMFSLLNKPGYGKGNK